MVWRGMGEGILVSLLVLGVTIYVLYASKVIIPIQSWQDVINAAVKLLGAALLIGAVYGFWFSMRIKLRLEPLTEAMALLEKGNFSRAPLQVGEDEIGRLGDQLERITKIWEDQVTSLQRLSSHNAQLAEQARYSAIVEERQRLARELHDAVSQQLFAISMTATAVGRTFDKDLEKAKHQVHLIEEMASVAQSEMRALLLHLRPVHLEGKRLKEGLIHLFHEIGAKVPMQIVWDIDEDIGTTKGIENHLFRIVQEALSNAMRHSKAAKLEIRLHQRIDGIRLLLRDNGVGFDLVEAKTTSYGLKTMQERVSEVGGSLQIVTAPGKGTRIEIRIPIMAEEGVEVGP
jgi:two-component system, NarL family, sensor histidine kinase LiaS